MFATGDIGEKFTCPHCSTVEEKVKFYNLKHEGDPICPKCGAAHNPLESLRLKSYYQTVEEETIETIEGNNEEAVDDAAVVLEDTSELGGGEEILPEAAVEPSEGESE
ncbi:MAG: FYDLN acid domain-containing protein [Alphaproteobacteria bacterium]